MSIKSIKRKNLNLKIVAVKPMCVKIISNLQAEVSHIVRRNENDIETVSGTGIQEMTDQAKDNVCIK